MNALIVGTDKTPILDYLPSSYLLIDDGPLIDALTFPKRRKVTRLDFTHDHFNPLRGIDYKRARDFITILDSIFPEGANTLTRRDSNFHLLKALRSNAKRLDTLIAPPNPRSDKGHIDAYQKIQTLLFSPVLENVLCNPTNISFSGIILARLDRAILGDFDSFVLANLLIGQYKGTVAISDFGFYACAFHTSLIRQDRLIAGVNSLTQSRLKDIRDDLLTIDTKIGSHCTFDDAEVLAQYAGLRRDSNKYNEYVAEAIA